MKTRQRDHSLGEGVYYATDDYVGIERRVVMICVDLAVIIGLGFVLARVLAAVYRDADEMDALRAGFFSWLAFAVFVVAYMTVIKASKIRTVGYRVVDAKIVDLRGRRPSFIRMLLRLTVWIFGPFSFLFDLIWAGIDQDRQTIRDRFLGTCVVRNSAQPVGTGEIHMAYFTAGGLSLFYPHVTHRDTDEEKPED